VNALIVTVLPAIPSQVIWSYIAGGAVLAIGLVAILLRGDWQRSRGFDKLILFGPLSYAAPLAAFGTEHFTLTKVIASIMPAWIPWHPLWVYFVGACFIAAALSLVTGIEARLSATLLALTFLLFVVLMHAPNWAQNPRNRFALAVALREMSFSGGALALAASLNRHWRERGTPILATIARCFVAVPVLFFSLEQFGHGDYVPAIPLDRITPEYVYGHALWTYLAAAVYAVAGTLLLVGKKTRAAAMWLGLTVLLVELAVYMPIGVVERASLDKGLNYVADTLMFCGAVLLLAGAMPREGAARGSASIMASALSSTFRQTSAVACGRGVKGGPAFWFWPDRSSQTLEAARARPRVEWDKARVLFPGLVVEDSLKLSRPRLAS
jgi:uncharacterized membrane protein YphA (DoxX/SURF4 family)